MIPTAQCRHNGTEGEFDAYQVLLNILGRIMRLRSHHFVLSFGTRYATFVMMSHFVLRHSNEKCVLYHPSLVRVSSFHHRSSNE